MNGITPPMTNFANANYKCTAFPGNKHVHSCPQIADDIRQCQVSYGKTIIISLGGATYSQGGWSSASDAESAAQLVWDMFGPVVSGSSVDRPFGSAVVDGFDFDFESATNNLPAFGAKLRSLMDAAGGKKYYLSAAPQCVFPDAANGAALNAVAFDFVMVQFYNNFCGVSNFQTGAAAQSAFNFDVWANWTKYTSPNKNVKLLLGIPAAPGAGDGFVNGAMLKAAISYAQQFSSFGGVMMWDMSQLYANDGFLNEVVGDLGSSTSPPSITTAATPTRTVTPTGSPSSPSSDTPPSGILIARWGQCGGQGYQGPSQCQSPYACVSNSPWWSQCQ